jgi:arylsulfatase A-like enzyme
MLLAMLGACGAGPQPASMTSNHPGRHSGSKLVVVVVLDQFGSWVLERYSPFLPEDGFLRTLIARGAYFEAARYEYAGTYTAPGHAAIFTGAPPARSNVSSNRIWDRARGRDFSTVDDGRHAIFGHEGAFASPSILRAPTVGDRLKEESAGRARVVAISMKDRSAVLPGGMRPDAAVWFDKAGRGFSTSTFYAPAMPDWLTRFRETHPFESYLEEWTPEDPVWLAREFGSDDASGEGDWEGFGTTFPHDASRSRSPANTFMMTPGATRYELDVTRAAISEFGLGADEVPDLLALSISAIDIVGHTFGPESWEYADNLVRVDHMLGQFMRELEAQTTVSWLVTADHGVVRLPERAAEHGEFGGRLLARDVESEARAAVVASGGAGGDVLTFVQPLVYFSAALREGPQAAEAASAVVARLRQMPCVHSAYRVADADSLAASNDPVERASAASIDADRRGDVFVVPRHGCLVDEDSPEGFGTSHGTPWDYDARVPVIVAHGGMSPYRVSEEVEQNRVAATVAELLGIQFPSGGGVRRSLLLLGASGEVSP